MNTPAEILERRRTLLAPSYRHFYREPVEFVRGRDVFLYDADGAEYLDAYNNVPSVGHCHPRVVEAVARQASTLNTHTRYLDEAILNYSERLLDTFPEELGQVVYTCSGSEAVDLAVRVARYRSAGTGIIVTSNAYHGTTAVAASMSPSLGQGVPLGPDVVTVDLPSDESPDSARESFRAEIRRAVDRLQRHGHGVAAFVADSIFSSDGVVSHPLGLLADAAEIVREAGGVYIADEVQPGFGRTGEHMWGFQRHGVVPDLVVLGKPMGNGIPVAAVVTRAEHVAEFGERVRYFNTFGGNSVSIAAADAVLTVLQDQSLQENARNVGQLLCEGLRELSDRYPLLGTPRGVGLFIGVDVLGGSPGLAQEIVDRFRDERVLIGTAGARSDALKIRPPLTFSPAHAMLLLERAERVFASVART